MDDAHEVGDPPWRAREVRALLGAHAPFSYQRLDRLYDFTLSISPPRSGAGREAGGWRMFEPSDVARMAVVIELSWPESMGAPAREGQRLRGLARIRGTALELMKPPFELRDPLLQVRWLRQGQEILVWHRGDLISPERAQPSVPLLSPSAPEPRAAQRRSHASAWEAILGCLPR